MDEADEFHPSSLGQFPDGLALVLLLVRVDLLRQAVLGAEILQPALDDLGDDLLGLTLVDGPLGEDLAFLFHVGGVELETKNMIGVIGVAPADKEGVLTVTPGSHGGNMDCTRITEGSTILFPVEAPGALLAMGDLHAVMGDGEVFGYGMEVSGEVTVRVSVIKNANIEQPTLIEGGDVMTVASGETLERATENALTSMYHLVDATGMDRSQAGILMSCRCDLAICEIVNPLYTVRATMPRSMVKIPE